MVYFVTRRYAHVGAVASVMSYSSPALFVPSPTDFVYKPCTSSIHNSDLNFEAHRLKLFSHLHESSRDSDVLNLPIEVDDVTRETSSTEPAFRPSLNKSSSLSYDAAGITLLETLSVTPSWPTEPNSQSLPGKAHLTRASTISTRDDYN